jgi:hypothetical protein
VPKAHV